MEVLELFNSKNVLHGLMNQTISLAREAKEIKTMKRYIYCYDIFDITNQINDPWEEHPGRIYGDLGAFVDLELTCKEIILKQDPSPYSVRNYVLNITRFLIFWKKSMDNHILAKKYPSITS